MPLAGIDPKTKKCVIVGENNADTAEEIRKSGLISVPVSKEKARANWGETVQDIYALAEAQP